MNPNHRNHPSGIRSKSDTPGRTTNGGSNYGSHQNGKRGITNGHNGKRKQPTLPSSKEQQDEPVATSGRDETEEEYRLRVYGTLDVYGEEPSRELRDERRRQLTSSKKRDSSFRRLSRQLSRQLSLRRSSLLESLPETPAGWAIFASLASSALLGYEVSLQHSLTCPPLVFGQCCNRRTDNKNDDPFPMKDIYARLVATPDSILRRPIKPSLGLGTRGVVSSTAAYLVGGPEAQGQCVKFRQELTMPADGAVVSLDWEVPAAAATRSEVSSSSKQVAKDEVLKGPIQHPVVLILHGINNDSTFGYIQSLMRTCTNRGWIAAGMNFRGCGGLPLRTPRGYNGAYTGDLRAVVYHIAGRLAEGVTLFIVGNSLGANLVTKYLGEEGLCGTLPSCVAGGVSLGNPLIMNSTKIAALWSPLLALGAKKNILENWSAICQMKSPSFQHAVRKALLAVTLGDFDEALAPIFVRNEPVAPFQFRIGFKNGQSYWTDASSYRLIRFISVPTLQLVAGDDFLVFGPFRGRLSYSLANPNVMVVETKCGGHLGWQESPPDAGTFGITGSASWSNVATADFIQATLETYNKQNDKNNGRSMAWPDGNSLFSRNDEELRGEAMIRSRL